MFNINISMGISDLAIGAPRYCYTTQDYNNCCEGIKSPRNTDIDEQMFKKNEYNKRKKIEECLSIIPHNEKNELLIYMKRVESDYVEQDIDIKLINKNDEKKIEANYKLLSGCDIGTWHNTWNVWNEFDYSSFMIKCDLCKKITNAIGCKNIICNECVMLRNKNDFMNKWKNASPIDKLKFYGKQKLIVLAKRKDIKGYTKMSKKELFNILKNIVSDNDFPIK